MELALYCPVYGYYEKEGDRIGLGGDYYTSVSAGRLLGELLGFLFAGWMAEGESEIRNPKPEVRNGDTQDRQHAETEAGAVGGRSVVQLVEAGAHDGKLAGDILGWMQQNRPELYERLEYWIVEPSRRRREWQERALGEFAGKVWWAEELSGLGAEGGPEGVGGVIFSNELLDAMPVRRMGWDAGRREWFEWGVTVKAGRFVWTRMVWENPKSEIRNPKEIRGPKSEARGTNSRLGEAKEEGWLPIGVRVGRRIAAELREVLPDGYTVEVSPAAEAWWRQAAGVLRWGRLMTLDYGLTGEEWLAPERRGGTLRAYRGHTVCEDVLEAAGERDITAHVNFGAIQAAGEAMGLQTEMLASQERFLTEIAAQTWAQAARFGEWTAERRRTFRTLTHPEHLGRAFRVLVQRRGGNGGE